MPRKATQKSGPPSSAASFDDGIPYEDLLALASSSGAVAGTKRKMSDKPQKYYAVRTGAKPGVYLSWPECQAQISGFKGAQYKSFLTMEDAKAFVAGKNPPSSAAANKTSTKKDAGKFYAVARGIKPGIYTDWETASAAIVGAKGPKYKKFATMDEAKAFMNEWKQTDINVFAAPEQEDDEQSPAKKTKTAASDGDIPGNFEMDVIKIYTDGSCLGNGVNGATAGVGVYFGRGDPRNISERLRGMPQTNQRAELTAILRALQVVPLEKPVRIFSDSKYAINCVTDWAIKWRQNGWRTADGPVKNRDIVQAVLERIDERTAKGGVTQYTWVKGHATDVGNVAADALAVRGAKGG